MPTPEDTKIVNSLSFADSRKQILQREAHRRHEGQTTSGYQGLSSEERTVLQIAKGIQRLPTRNVIPLSSTLFREDYLPRSRTGPWPVANELLGFSALEPMVRDQTGAIDAVGSDFGTRLAVMAVNATSSNSIDLREEVVPTTARSQVEVVTRLTKILERDPQPREILMLFDPKNKSLLLDLLKNPMNNCYLFTDQDLNMVLNVLSDKHFKYMKYMTEKDPFFWTHHPRRISELNTRDAMRFYTGNIVGQEAIGALADTLRANGEQVGIIFESNVHISADDLSRILHVLPTTKDTLIIKTQRALEGQNPVVEKDPSFEGEQVKWLYVLLHPQQIRFYKPKNYNFLNFHEFEGRRGIYVPNSKLGHRSSYFS